MSKRCAKCLTVLKVEDKKVRDALGNVFCSRSCLRGWWEENRKENEDIYNFLIEKAERRNNYRLH